LREGSSLFFFISIMTEKPQKNSTEFEKQAEKITSWIGSPASIVLHTLAFGAAFVLVLFGIRFDTVLLILTTAVSLEAIYLALFIQMTVNRNTQSLAEVEEDIDEIQEDVEGIEKDIDEIQEDVDKLEEEDEKDNVHDVATINTLSTIQKDLNKLLADIETLKNQQK
jgi:low affinity Fe/Cu permease